MAHRPQVQGSENACPAGKNAQQLLSRLPWEHLYETMPNGCCLPSRPGWQILPQPSQLVVTTLERPLGIVFEEDKRRKRVVVAGFSPGVAGH